MTNNDFRFGYDNATAGSRVNMNVSGSGSMQFGNADMREVTLRISGGSVSSDGTANMDQTAGMAPTIWVDGSGASSISFNTLDAFNNSGDATLRYTADAGGLKAIDVTTLNLNSASNTSILDVDLTNWDGSTGLVGSALILADYGTLSGTFSSVNITGGSGTLDYAYDLGGGDFAIAVVIPEPSSLLLLTLAGTGLVVLGRRRR